MSYKVSNHFSTLWVVYNVIWSVTVGNKMYELICLNLPRTWTDFNEGHKNDSPITHFKTMYKKHFHYYSAKQVHKI